MAVLLVAMDSSALADHRGKRDCRMDTALHEEDRVHVYLTLSPLASTSMTGTIKQRLVELNWFNGPSLPAATGDWIGLFEHDPADNATLPLIQISAKYPPYHGYFKSDIVFGYPNSERGPIDGSCLGYWIAYIRNGATIASNCLKMQPSWMWQNRQVLGSMPINAMFLPGTHNSGSQRPYVGHQSDTVFMRYLICQDEDIWNQLAYGIRYLDVRVGFYPDKTPSFWINHNYAKINPLATLVDDVKLFMQGSREVVIIDFHRFPKGFDEPESHAKLVEYVERELGEYMAPSNIGAHVTLDQLWAINKTLIVAYAHGTTRAAHPLLWPSIPQEWGDKRSVEELYSFLNAVNDQRLGDSYLWAAMAELTPSTLDVIFRPWAGLRKLSQLTNANVTRWYRDRWWPTANIVAVDFFRGTDIVDVALRSNVKRAQCLIERRSTTATT